MENSISKKTAALAKLKLIELYIKDESLEKSIKLLDEIKYENTDDPDVIQKIDYVSGLLIHN